MKWAQSFGLAYFLTMEGMTQKQRSVQKSDLDILRSGTSEANKGSNLQPFLVTNFVLRYFSSREISRDFFSKLPFSQDIFRFA